MNPELLPQIPWAYLTRVVDLGPDWIEFESENHRIQVADDGGVWIDHDSRAEIQDYLRLDPEHTRKLREWLEISKDHFSQHKAIQYWLGLGEFASVYIPPGKKEWRPKDDLDSVLEGLSPYGGHWVEPKLNDTIHFTDWGGDLFEFWLFDPDKILREDQPDLPFGVVICWGRGPIFDLKDIEVRYGDWVAFRKEEYQPGRIDASSIWKWNRGFENALVWGMDYIGYIDGLLQLMREGNPPHQTAALDPLWPLKLLEYEPDFLWPELVLKFLPYYDSLPKRLQKAIGQWSRERGYQEREAGQQVFWPRISPRRRRRP